MKIAITGSHGLIGSALAAHLEREGHEVARARRVAGSAPGAGPGWYQEDFTGAGAVVHLAGEPIGARRWGTAEKRRIADSRSMSTRALVEMLLAMPEPPATLVSGSAVGYYGDRGEELLTEESGPGDGFLAEVCRAWEAAAARASRPGTSRPGTSGPGTSGPGAPSSGAAAAGPGAAPSGARLDVVMLRTGVVLSAAGGALARQLRIFRAGLGGKLGTGRQFVSWIALDDAVRAIAMLATGTTPGLATGTAPGLATGTAPGLATGAGTARPATITGPVNLTSPGPVTNSVLTAALASALHRPALLGAPAPLLGLALGREMAAELLLASQRAMPARLLEAGFHFEHPEIVEAMRHAVSQRPER
ncbi:MAG: epimerase [Acidimicrobiales bacterium]